MADETGNKLPKEALNLFDSLICNLINSTEKLSFQQNIKQLQNYSKSHEFANQSNFSSTTTPEFDHSFLISNKTKSKEKCQRNDGDSVSKSTSKESINFSKQYPENCGSTIQTENVTEENLVTLPSMDQKLDMLLKNEDISPTRNFVSKKVSNVCQSCVALEKFRSIEKFVQVKCCDSGLTSRIVVEKDSEVIVQNRNSSIGVIEQQAFLTTRRLAKNRDGCELTFSTTDPNGQPIVIRVLCPNFEPTKVWLNGKAYEYIESESLNKPENSETNCFCLEYEKTLTSTTNSGILDCSNCCSRNGSMNFSFCSCFECQSLCSCLECQK